MPETRRGQREPQRDTQNLKAHRFKKGRSGNPKGRPKEKWREWLTSDRVEPQLRELLLQFANDLRVRVETRVRIIEFVLNHTHGRPKEAVEIESKSPPVMICPDAIYRRMIEMTNAEKPPLETIPESIYRQLEMIVAEVKAKRQTGDVTQTSAFRHNRDAQEQPVAGK